jgi:hypothetical protein
MLKLFVVIAAVALSGHHGYAQIPAACLHGQLESQAERARREHAIKVAHQINALQSPFGGLPGGRFRRPSELKMPPMPNNFEMSFYTDGRTYMFSLKDSSDPCHFAVFSDDQRLVYAATPGPPVAVVVPADTR